MHDGIPDLILDIFLVRRKEHTPSAIVKEWIKETPSIPFYYYNYITTS